MSEKRRRWPAFAVAGAASLLIAATVVLASGGDEPPAGPSVPAAAPALSTSVPPSVATTPVATAGRTTLEVPAIGVRTGPIIDLGLTSDGALQVPDDALTTGWYTGSPAPGDPGPSVLAAHVDYHQVPGQFVRLKELTPGTEALVHRADGTTAVFEIYRVEHYPKTAFPTDAVYGDTPGPELRLITCGGEFDSSAASYRDNIVVYAKLSRTEPG